MLEDINEDTFIEEYEINKKKVTFDNIDDCEESEEENDSEYY